jgi:hypothetical protein
MKQTVSGGEALARAQKAPDFQIRKTFCARETTVSVWSQLSVATHGLAQKCTYQPTLAYSRRLP